MPTSRQPRAQRSQTRRSRSPDQSVGQREEYELGARLELQLAHDVSAVRVDGSHRDEELLTDLLVRVSECEQVEDVALPVGYGLERRRAVGDDELRAEIGVDVALAGRNAADRFDHLGVGGS